MGDLLVIEYFLQIVNKLLKCLNLSYLICEINFLKICSTTGHMINSNILVSGYYEFNLD